MQNSQILTRFYANQLIFYSVMENAEEEKPVIEEPEENGEPVAKKGRGRPRKASPKPAPAKKEDAKDKDEKEEDVKEEDVAKRGRGRPRKFPPVEKKESSGRPRGRPKGSGNANVSPADVPLASEKAKTGRKPRGRPPKTAA